VLIFCPLDGLETNKGTEKIQLQEKIFILLKDEKEILF
jgi:hypothetical protein